MGSAPRYGLTVTASAPRPSNRAIAWRAAVDPMSARLASITTGRSDGTADRSRSRAASPAEPNASKNARFGFTAATNGSRRLDDEGAERLDAVDVAAEPGWQRRRDPGRARDTARCRSPCSAKRAARGTAVAPARTRRRSRRSGPATRGRGGDRRWRGQLVERDEPHGREAPSSPETTVRSIVSLTRNAGAVPVRFTIRRSTIWPWTCRNAMASPGATRPAPRTRHRR